MSPRIQPEDLAETWRSLLLLGASSDAERLWRAIAREAGSDQCPLCLEEVPSRRLKNHQRGDWCRIGAVARRAKLLGLVPVRSQHQPALERAGLPFTPAPVGKTESMGGNSLQMGLFTLAGIARTIEGTKAGRERDAALVGFRSESMTGALMKLPAAARRRPWSESWSCPRCDEPVLFGSAIGTPIVPRFCPHVLAALAGEHAWASNEVQEFTRKVLGALGSSGDAKRLADLVPVLARRMAVGPSWRFGCEAVIAGEEVICVPSRPKRVVFGAELWRAYLVPAKAPSASRGKQESRTERPPEISVWLGEAWAIDPLFARVPQSRAAWLEVAPLDEEASLLAVQLSSELDPDGGIRELAARRMRSLSKGPRAAAGLRTAVQAVCVPLPNRTSIESLLTLLEESELPVAERTILSLLALRHPDRAVGQLAWALLEERHPLSPALAAAVASTGRHVDAFGFSEAIPNSAVLANALDWIAAEGAVGWSRMNPRWRSTVVESDSPPAQRVRAQLVREEGLNYVDELKRRFVSESQAGPVIDLGLERLDGRLLRFALEQDPIREALASRVQGLSAEQLEVCATAALATRGKGEDALLDALACFARGDTWWRIIQYLDAKQLRALPAPVLERELHAPQPKDAGPAWHRTRERMAAGLVGAFGPETPIGQALRISFPVIARGTATSSPRPACVVCNAGSGAMQAGRGGLRCSKCGAAWEFATRGS